MDSRIIFKIFWLPCLLAIMLAALLYWRDRDIKNLADIYANKESDFNAKYGLLASSEHLKEQLANYDEQTKNFHDDLFSLDEAVTMIRTIAEMSGNYQVRLTDFEYDIPKYLQQKRLSGQESAVTVPFEASFAGYYINIGKFIEQLEKRIYLANIYDMKFQNNTNTPGEVNCVFKGALKFIDRAKLELADNGE